ncbi:hypothetical protein [Oligoflexus tunisiensis]|uniref:hypothetical protein n=1 Tax=Oligoflexus tunisiensis TaxID=708132 RepID=UPI00114CD19E|nr:hypothetical protein [Oligoflexus tunisiensis]
MTRIWGQGKFTPGIILGGQGKFTPAIILALTLGLGSACNDAGFQSGNSLTLEQETAAAADAQAQSGDATPEFSNHIPAQVETTMESSKKPDTIINSFESSKTREASFRFKLEPKGVKTEFTLEDNLAPVTDNFTQINRQPLTDTFTQGHAGTTIREEFDQAARQGLADILVVIDNSGSMKEEQTNLSSKLNELLVSIKDASWQISVITTAPAVPAGVSVNTAAAEGKELCNTTLIKSGEADASEKFATAVNAGISGSGNEQGIRQSVVGLRCTEKPWVRTGSTLAVLIVSDEDNCSNDGSDCGSLPWAKESYLTNYVENTLQRTIGKNAGFYGIVAPSKALCSTAGNAAPQYLRLFDYKANGAVNYGNICDGSYKTTLNRISDSIALLLNNQFELKTLPDDGTLKLSLLLSDNTTRALDASSYTRNGKVISFVAGKEPPAGSKVVAEYRTGSKPILSSFTLSQDPAAGTVIAKINGAAASAGSYTVSGRTVTFTNAPADMATITLDYRENKALLDRFKTTADPVTGSIKVSVNGQATTDFTFDAAKREVVLKNLPADNQTVEIGYKKNAGPRLEYTPPVSPDGRNFQILDQTQPVAFTKNGNTFTISADAFQAGRTLTLSYDVPDNSTKAFELGRLPIAGSTDIVDAQGDCDLGVGFEIVDDRLISNCVITNAMEFTLNYKYIETVKIFKVFDVANPEAGVWTVYINGEATKDFVRSGSSIALTQDPGAEARIDIHYTLPE